MTRTQFVVVALAGSLMIGCNRDHRTNTASNASGSPSEAVGTAGANDKDKPGLGDKNFVRDVAKANTAEIDLGKLAADKATDPEVKKFAQMMTDDHTRAEGSLKAIATEKGIEWPSDLDGQDRDKHDDLAKKQGADFDRDYVSHMVDAHKDLVDKLESRIDKKDLAQWKSDMENHAAGKSAHEREKAVEIVPEKSDNAVTMRINEWAAATYPVAYSHLQAAKTLESTLKRRHTTP